MTSLALSNPLEIPSGESFVVGESDLRYYYDRPQRLSGGAIWLCERGSAELQVDLRSFSVRPNAQVVLIPPSIVMLSQVSPDFQVRFFSFSDEFFEEATYRMEIEFFRFLKEHPVHCYSTEMATGLGMWLQLSAYIYADREHLFRHTIVRNRLQNAFLELYDKMKRYSGYVAKDTQPSRQVEIFQRFITLVHEYATCQRDVAFYADKLCISTRYLSAVTRNVAHASVKEIIDRMVLLEIRMLLQSTDLSVQEIADRLSFPDQSYLGRYFKKHTGESPTAYRNGRNS